MADGTTATPPADPPRGIASGPRVMAVALLTAVLGGAGIALHAAPWPARVAGRLLQALSPEPPFDKVPLGPVLAQAQRQGELVVGVRAYRRPAPPGAPTPAEPDNFDAALARYLGKTLRVRVALVGIEADARTRAWPPFARPVDLVIAGAGDVPAAAAQVPVAYAGGDGRLVVARRSAYQSGADLRQKEVCVPQGSPYARALARHYGAVPRVYPSAIHAISGFMAGECQALAEDGQVLARLAGLPEWRFYRRLDDSVAADDAGPQIGMRADDPVSSAYLIRAVRAWKADGGLAEARTRRAGDVSFEAGQLQDGLVCHS